MPQIQSHSVFDLCFTKRKTQKKFLFKDNFIIIIITYITYILLTARMQQNITHITQLD